MPDPSHDDDRHPGDVATAAAELLRDLARDAGRRAAAAWRRGVAAIAPPLRGAARHWCEFGRELRDRGAPVVALVVATVISAARSGAGWVRHRVRTLREAAARRSGRRSRGPRRRIASSLPLTLLVLLATIAGAGIAAGALAMPTLSLAASTVTTVREDVLDVPALPEAETPDQRSIMYAADGSRLGYLVGEQNRVLATLDEIPDVLEQAVVATEDATFYEHDGIDPSAILRAAVRNVVSGEVEQGGSTITQQYVKNALLTPARTISRKVQEALYSVSLEDELSKDEILERYLNITYFGNGAYGVSAAAQYYFDKPLEEIGLSEAAILAGSIRSPEATNAEDAPDRAAGRREYVLDRMVDEGYVTRDEADAAAAVPVADLVHVNPPEPPQYPFFSEYVKQRLLEMEQLGDTREERVQALFTGGLRIHTTLVPRTQRFAVDSIARFVKDPATDPLGGLVSIEPSTGRVVSMAVGPKGWGECEGDRQTCATTKVNPLVPGLGGSGRQAGSAFKPILDVTALSQGIDTDWHTETRSGQTIPGCEGPEGPWEPSNYVESTSGDIDMVEAIRRSNNVFHAKLMAEVGPKSVVEMAGRLGFGPDLPAVCSLALGAVSVFPIDMAEAYATFANRGVHCEPFVVTEVTDAEGNVLVRSEPDCERVLDQETSDELVTMLQNVVRSGTGTAARIGRPAGGKTGTTDDYRDAWFLGFTPQLATAAWVGYEIPQEMRGILGYRVIAGGTVPAAMWGRFTSGVLDGTEVSPLPRVHLDRWVPPPPEPEKKKDDEKGDKKKRRGRDG